MAFTLLSKFEILRLREAGYVKRWHTAPYVAGPQSDAEHSAQALSLLFMLCPVVTTSMAKVMLWHDCGEIEVGDLPSPSLRRNPDLRAAYKNAESRYIATTYPRLNEAMGDLAEDEKQWIHECDVLELCLFAREQVDRGVEYFRDVCNRGLAYLNEIPTLHKEVRDFVDLEFVNPSSGLWKL